MGAEANPVADFPEYNVPGVVECLNSPVTSDDLVDPLRGAWWALKLLIR